MTNRELLELYTGLQAIKKLKGGVKYAYLVSRNLQNLKQVCVPLQESIAPPPEFRAFESQKLALGKKYAEKDERGRPKMKTDGGQVSVKLADTEGFQSAYAELVEEHQATIDAYNEKLRAYEKLLDESAESVWTLKIPVDILPDDITPEQLEPILSLIAGSPD